MFDSHLYISKHTQTHTLSISPLLLYVYNVNHTSFVIKTFDIFLRFGDRIRRSGDHCILLPPVDIIGERHDVELVILAHLIQDGVHGRLGLAEFSRVHGGAEVQNEHHPLVHWRQGTRCETMDEVWSIRLQTVNKYKISYK